MINDTGGVELRLLFITVAALNVISTLGVNLHDDAQVTSVLRDINTARITSCVAKNNR